MGLTKSIHATFRKSFDFSGRASRSEFWAFFPLRLSLTLIVGGSATFLNTPIWVVLLLMAIAALPLFAAGARRLQNTGVPGEDAVAPWLFAIATVFAIQASLSLHTTLHSAMSGPNPADGPSGLGMAIFFGGGKWVFIFAALFSFLIFIVRMVPAFGQCLVPSQPGPNKYGPNPNEVPQ